MENHFDLLEEKVKKAADLVRKLRKQNQTLEEEIAKLLVVPGRRVLDDEGLEKADPLSPSE